MSNILDRLINYGNRETMNKNYVAIWKSFNKFVLKLDVIPKSWENRVSLFCTHLVHKGCQSSTIRSYVSAIKCILIRDGYKWKDELLLLGTLSKACKIVNDWVKTRLPIYYQLLETLLFELRCKFHNQHYLCITYQSILMLGYYGLLRTGELTSGDHPILVCNVHMAKNKNKLMLVLFSSKTHSVSDPSQKIKISGINNKSNGRKHFCPFNTTREYMHLRGNYLSTKLMLVLFSSKTHSVSDPPQKIKISGINNKSNCRNHSTYSGEESQLSQRMLEQS